MDSKIKLIEIIDEYNDIKDKLRLEVNKKRDELEARECYLNSLLEELYEED